MKKTLGHATAGNRTTSIAANDLRWSILDEERLRWSIAHEENLRQRAPDTWRVWEASRLQQTREKAQTNRQLKALGLELLRLEPSLAQRRQELQRLEGRSQAKIAEFQQRSKETGRKSHGTPLAGRRGRRTDD